MTTKQSALPTLTCRELIQVPSLRADHAPLGQSQGMTLPLTAQALLTASISSPTRKLGRRKASAASRSKIMKNGDTQRGAEVRLSRQLQVPMIGRMIAPPAQMMLPCRPKFKFLRFQMTVNTPEWAGLQRRRLHRA